MLQTEVRVGDSVGEVEAESYRQSTDLVILTERRVTIGCVLWGSRATGTGWWTGGSARELDGAGATYRQWETCGDSTEREVIRGAVEGTRAGLDCRRW
jgi:hypothetical protein